MSRMHSVPGVLFAASGLAVLVSIGSSFVPQTVTAVRRIGFVGESQWPPAPGAIVNLDDIDDQGRYEGLNLMATGQQKIYTVPAGKCLVLMDFALQGSPGENTKVDDTNQLSLRERIPNSMAQPVLKLRRGITVSGWQGSRSASTGFRSSLGVVFGGNMEVVLYVNDNYTPAGQTGITDIRVEAFNGYLVDC